MKGILIGVAIIVFCVFMGFLMVKYLPNASSFYRIGSTKVMDKGLVRVCKSRNQMVWELFANQYSLTIDSASADLVAIGLVKAVTVVDLVMETMETLQMGCVEE